MAITKADEEIVVEKIPLRVGDIVRMIFDPQSYGYNLNSVSTTITTSSNNTQAYPWGTYIVTPPVRGSQPVWVNPPNITISQKLPPLGTAMVITGVIRNELFPLDVQDLETGEEYEIYRYQIKRDDFMTAVHRRREARTAAIIPAIECAPRIEEQRLLEAAI